MKAKFDKLQFNNKAELKEWLEKTYFFKIDLVDFGQDMLTMWVHESGEILQCDFHSRIYAGKFIDVSQLMKGQPIVIVRELSGGKMFPEVMERLVVEKLDIKSNPKSA
jgi:hypothetical protein